MYTYTKNVLKTINNVTAPNHFKASSPSKISVKKDNSFSMLAGPQFSCPKATTACEDCYAMKGRHHMPNVQLAMIKNWLLIKEFSRTRQTTRAVQELLKIIPKKARMFRIHESGDFFNNWYVKVWAEVIKQRSDVLFFTYTRSFHLNFAPLTKLKNFTLWASSDQYNLKEAKKFVRRYRKSGTKHAYGPYPHRKRIPRNSTKCPSTTKKISVEGACEKCMLCVVKKRINKNMVFLEH